MTVYIEMKKKPMGQKDNGSLALCEKNPEIRERYIEAIEGRDEDA